MPTSRRAGKTEILHQSPANPHQTFHLSLRTVAHDGVAIRIPCVPDVAQLQSPAHPHQTFPLLRRGRRPRRPAQEEPGFFTNPRRIRTRLSLCIVGDDALDVPRRKSRNPSPFSGESAPHFVGRDAHIAPRRSNQKRAPIPGESAPCPQSFRFSTTSEVFNNPVPLSGWL